MKKLSRLLPCLAILIIFSCKRDIAPVITGTIPDLGTKVNSSVSGFVTNENDMPVPGAQVKVGTAILTTDNFGYFNAEDVQVVKEAAVVSIVSPGYFNAIKTWKVVENQPAFFRIKLLPKIIDGSFASTSGGTVSLTNGMSLSIPASAIKTAAGPAYTGQVNVSVKWIDPTSPDLIKIMPGDLRGINTGGFINSLTTYGMTAVELSGSAGELLQIADGKKATLTFPLPSGIAGTAPSSIPLWYFNETTGLWVEEGSAVRTGNSYTGDVSHFSFWNCDVPNTYVEASATILDPQGNPLPFTSVKIWVTSNPGIDGYGMTNEQGFVSGFVPDNAQLTLGVFPSTCPTPVHTVNFNTTNTAIALGNITIPSSAILQANVSGSVTDCNNQPVSMGTIFVVTDQGLTYYPINAGQYSFSLIYCGVSPSVTLYARDNVGSQESNAVYHTTSVGSNVIPMIQACGTVILPYDGKFNLTGIHNRPMYQYPYVNVPMEMITVAPATVAFYFVDASSYGHPIAIDTFGTLSWYGPTLAPQVTFDVATDLVVNVTNMNPTGPSISKYTGSIPTFNHYDRITRKIYVAWQYNNDPNRAFFDTLTYTGPR